MSYTQETKAALAPAIRNKPNLSLEPSDGTDGMDDGGAFDWDAYDEEVPDSTAARFSAAGKYPDLAKCLARQSPVGYDAHQCALHAQRLSCVAILGYNDGTRLGSLVSVFFILPLLCFLLRP